MLPGRTEKGGKGRIHLCVTPAETPNQLLLGPSSLWPEGSILNGNFSQPTPLRRKDQSLRKQDLLIPQPSPTLFPSPATWPAAGPGSCPALSQHAGPAWSLLDILLSFPYQIDSHQPSALNIFTTSSEPDFPDQKGKDSDNTLHSTARQTCMCALASSCLGPILLSCFK